MATAKAAAVVETCMASWQANGQKETEVSYLPELCNQVSFTPARLDALGVASYSQQQHAACCLDSFGLT